MLVKHKEDSFNLNYLFVSLYCFRVIVLMVNTPISLLLTLVQVKSKLALAFETVLLRVVCVIFY